MKKIAIEIFATVLMFTLPMFALAHKDEFKADGTGDLTCANSFLGANATCNSSGIQLQSGVTSYRYWVTPTLTIDGGTGATIYAVITSTGTTGSSGLNITTTVDNFFYPFPVNTTTQISKAGVGTAGTAALIAAYGTTYGGTSATNALITDICVSDVSFADCAGGGGGGGGTDPRLEIFGTSSVSYSIIDNPTQDIFMLYVAFAIGTWGVVALFKGRK